MKNQNVKIPCTGVLRVGVIGALVGLALISIFIFPIHHPRPEWGEFWRIRPLLVTPIVVSIGAICAYLFAKVVPSFGIHKTVSFLIGILGFIISIWLGIVLGLAGTLWN
jgi:preprotein translocase subunit Sss1